MQVDIISNDGGPVCGRVLQCTTSEGVDVDISLNSGGGVRAAAWLAGQQAAQGLAEGGRAG